MLEGMTLQLQGIALPLLLTSQGMTLELQGIAPSSLLMLEGRPLTSDAVSLARPPRGVRASWLERSLETILSATRSAILGC